MREAEMWKIACLINDALENQGDLQKLARIKKETIALTKKFPLYPELLR